MGSLFQADRLRERIPVRVEEEIRGGRLPFHTGIVLDAVLYRGEPPRSDVRSVLGIGGRQARRITSALPDREGLTGHAHRRHPLPSGQFAPSWSAWVKR